MLEIMWRWIVKPYIQFETDLKALIQPGRFAGATSWLAFVVAIFIGHEMAVTITNQKATHARYSGWIGAFQEREIK